jgi:hypothetical protein
VSSNDKIKVRNIGIVLVLEISEDEPETVTDREYQLPVRPPPAGG